MRSYGQSCGLARSLDLLGERWTLLVLRELMLGEARFRDFVEALPGAGTNLISARLKALEAAGVVARTANGYELTERGEALRPILEEELALWGAPFVDPADPDAATNPRWMALLMRAVMVRSGRARPDGVFAFAVDGEEFWLRCTGERVDVRRGRPPVPADATLRCDLATFARVAGGELKVGNSRYEVSGDRKAAGALLRAFRLPAATVA